MPTTPTLDFFGGQGLPPGAADPDKVPAEDQLRALRGQLNQCADDMTLYRAPQGGRAQFAISDTAAQLEGSMICERFAALRPDLAAAAGEPIEHWQVLIPTKLAYLEAQRVAAPIVYAARMDEMVLLQGLTDDVDAVRGTVQEIVADPATGDGDRDRLRAKFSVVDDQSQKLQAADAARKADEQRLVERATQQSTAAEDQARSLLQRAELKRRLATGQIPALGLHAKPTTPAKPKTGKARKPRTPKAKP